MTRTKLTTTLLLSGLITLSGCSNLGPQAIHGSRSDYNVAVRQTTDQQMLLNLVRLRYRDQPLFLEVSALNTRYSFQAGANAAGSVGDDDLFGVGGRVAIEESPTVTYTPLQGADFVERVLSPIRLETLLLLDTSGWSSERVFRILLDQLNELKNAPGSAGPTPSVVNEFEEFIRATRLLRELELKDLIMGGMFDGKLGLTFDSRARNLAIYSELMELLDLNPALGTYPITSTFRFNQQPGAINMRFRSFAGVMYFLSQAVEVPERDISAGRVTKTLDGNGAEFDWLRVTEGLMHIQSSKAQPENAAVAVHYRGSWFYIDDSDLNSKSTFSLLSQLFALQSGDATANTPVLTIPVGG